MTTSDGRVSRDVFKSPVNALLALRMVGWMVVLPLAKQVLPFERLARIMWRDRAGRSFRVQQALVIRLAYRLTRFSGSNCLERSLILYRYLGLCGADPTLVLGLGKDELQRRDGHAWLVVDGVPLIETQAELDSYEPIVAFGPGARRLSGPAATVR
jgi:hypothetical protein